MTLPQTACYRHADRPAGVACQRCDRPICPDCMRQASVGFHCPECAQASSQRVVNPAARWSTGRAAAGRPPVTTALIVVNVIALFIDLSSATGLDGGLIGRGIRGGRLVGVDEGEWWRMITGGFLHAGLAHLAFNMFALWSIGQLLERVLGPWRFAALYGSSLLAGSFGALLVQPRALTVGASGAVFGLFGALLVFQLSRGIPIRETGLGLILAINLGFTFLVPGISIGGHLGGLAGGFVAGVGLFGLPRAGKAPPAGLGVAVLAAVAVISFVGGLAVAGRPGL
jgi:membrane associated rhomboid family serine protease